MAYDIVLAERIARLLNRRRHIEQKQMFGGVCFLVRGNMCCGIAGNKLVVRVDPERYGSVLRCCVSSLRHHALNSARNLL